MKRSLYVSLLTIMYFSACQGSEYILLYTGSTVSVPPTDGGATRLPDSAGSIQEWILRRNLHRPCMPQLMEKSYTQEEREDMDTV